MCISYKSRINQYICLVCFNIQYLKLGCKIYNKTVYILIYKKMYCFLDNIHSVMSLLNNAHFLIQYKVLLDHFHGIYSLCFLLLHLCGMGAPIKINLVVTTAASYHQDLGVATTTNYFDNIKVIQRYS